MMPYTPAAVSTCEQQHLIRHQQRPAPTSSTPGSGQLLPGVLLLLLQQQSSSDYGGQHNPKNEDGPRLVMQHRPRA